MCAMRTSKTVLAAQLGVSRSSLYYRPKKPISDENLRAKIALVMAANRAYGHKRIATALRMNRKPVIRVMNRFGMRPVVRRGKRFTKPGDLGNEEIPMPNVLRALCPLFPGIVWAGDFTYFFLGGRFWYVATVIDIRTREIVGWQVGNHHTAGLVIEAFRDAVERTGRAPRWFHSDQGSEYAAEAFARTLEDHGTRQSMSRKSSPWQNGFQESFYAMFKLEIGDIGRFSHVGELIEAAAGQIAYYNDRRIHSALGMPPAQYRMREEQKTAALAALDQAHYSTRLLTQSV